MGDRGDGRGSDESGSGSKSRGGRCGGTGLSARKAAARVWQQKPRRGERARAAEVVAQANTGAAATARGGVVSADGALSGGYGGRHGAAGAAAEEHDSYKPYEGFRDDSHVARKAAKAAAPTCGQRTRAAEVAAAQASTGAAATEARRLQRRRRRLRQQRWGGWR